jgi:PGF-pre-PGF domain-containing protein
MNTNKLSRNLVFVLLLLLIISIVNSQSEYPALPAFYYGEATVNGRDIPLNSYIIAKINNEEKGEILVEVAGEYGREKGDSKLLVTGSPSTQGETIEFYLKIYGYEEIKADQTNTWMSGGINNLDLTFTGEEIEIVEPEPEVTTTSTSSSGGSGGPGGSYVVQSNEATFTYNLIEKGKQKDIDIDNDNLFLTTVRFVLYEDFNDVTLKFEKVSSTPENLDNAFEYIHITTPFSEEEVGLAVIFFKVPNSWFTDNNYDPEKVILMRYTDSWEALETNHIGNDANYNFYLSNTPGFSYFAAVAEKVDGTVEEIEEPEPELVEGPEFEEQEIPEPETDEESQESEITGMAVLGGQDGSKLVTVILAVILLIILTYIFYDKVIRGG